MNPREAESWRHTLTLLAVTGSALTMPDGLTTTEARADVAVIAAEIGLDAYWRPLGTGAGWQLAVDGLPGELASDDYRAGLRDARIVEEELLARQAAVDAGAERIPREVSYDPERIGQPDYQRGLGKGRELVHEARAVARVMAAGDICPACAATGTEHAPRCRYE